MEDLSKHSPIELNKMINDVKAKHDALKEEIIGYTFQAEELERKINEKLAILQEVEKNYVELIEEMSNR